MQRLLHILILLISLTGSGNVFAQETEAQLKEKADKLFEKQDFVAATPAYLQLLALQPRSPEYNYKYGTCLLFNGKKKQDAIKYLEFATASTSVDLEAFFYMGKAYHLNYQFDDAIKFYGLYKTNSRGKPNKELDVERQIEMCENGQKLLKNLTDIVVLEKKEYQFGEFYKLYDLQGFGGDILVSASDQSKLDKKKGHTPIIHFPPNAKQIFFASYGDNEANGKQIYVKQKLKEGGWSVPVPVKGEVNTKYDEEFPYMHPNGEYLYFSSKGHNSMGGYDVFKSKYDAATNSFGIPENVDFAISSADNDLFYIVDSLDKNAWFASSRQSQDGKINVYKVRVERLPSSIAAIRGTFSSTVHPENKKFNIEVKDLVSGRQIGTFYSEKDGSYLIALPKGGKYEYAIKITGSPEVFKAVVNVPVLNEFRPLKQEILHEETASKEVVKVIDLFDQSVENAESILAEVVKMRSELNPNVAQFDLQSLENPSGSNAVFASLGFQKLTPVEVKDKIIELTQAQTAQLKNLEELQQKALAKIVANTSAIKTLQNDFKNKVNETNKTPDPAEKYKLYVEAEKKATEITALEQANQQLLRYADSINKVIPLESKEALAAQKLEQLIAQAKADDVQLVKAISENKEQIKTLQAQNGQLPVESLTKEVSKLKAEMDQLTNAADPYRKTTQGLKSEIASLENKLSTAKAKDKPGIQSTIDAKKNELDLIEQEIKMLDKKITAKAAELDAKQDQLEYTQQIQHEKLPVKAVTFETAKKSVETQDPNYKTLKSYVAQQKAELEQKNPALAGNVSASEHPENNVGNPENNGGDPENPEKTPSNAVAATKILKEIKPDLDKRLDEIANNPNLSVLEQLKMAQNEELEFEQIVEEGISNLQNQLEETPSDKTLQTQLKNLQTLKKEVAERIDNRSLAISSLDPENVVVVDKPTKSEVLTQVKPGHETKMADINSNPDLSAREKIQALQNEDQSLQSAVNAQISTVEAQLKKNPNDSQTQAAYEFLQEIKAEVADRIAARQLELDKPEAVVPESNPEKEPLAIAVKPGHAEKIAEIANNDLLSPQEKQSKLIQEEVKLQKALETEIKKTDKLLEKTPEDQQLLAKKQQLTAVKDESQTRMDESSQVLIAEEKTQIKPAELLYKIDQNYQRDIQKIENGDGADEQEKLLEREKSSQQLLQAQIEKNKLQLAKKDNPKLAAENQVLNELIDASQKRVETPAVVEHTRTPVNVADLRTEKLGGNSQALTENRSAPEAVKDQQAILNQYQTELQTLLKENKTALSGNPKDTKLLAEQKVYQEELKTVGTKIQEVNKQLETETATKTNAQAVNVPEKNPIENNQGTEFSDHPDLRALQKEEITLKAKLADPNTSNKEKELVSKSIAENQTKQVKVSNILVEENIREKASNVAASVKTMENGVAIDPQSNEKQAAVLQSVKSSEANLAAQLKEAKSIKDPQAKQAILNQLAVQQQQNEAKLKQVQEAQAFSQTTASVREANPEITLQNLQSAKDLETQKRKGSIEFGDLNSEIERLDEEIKSSGKAKTKILVAERDAKIKERQVLETELTAISKELEERNAKPVSVYQEAAINENITYEQEREIAVSPEYKKYHALVSEANVLKNSITEKQQKLEALKAENHLLVAGDPQISTPETKMKIEENLLQIVSLTKEVATEKNQYAQKKQAAENSIKDSENAMKIQNLIARGVDPISKLVVVSTLVALPAKGFEIVSNPTSAPVKTNIPVGVSVPSGLVYRVQVGAFAKPIKEELFREFNPVSGEKLESGITRYMAGYFNNRGAVMDAREEIIKLGYSDAFPVAYCDGKRISMQEARRLEESKLCVPQGVDNLIVDASQRLSEALPANTTATNTNTTNAVAVNNAGAYNKAPGAADAIAVETRLGLFYTVQIGVYNKPVPASQIKNMEPLITKRLPNGQIRYSAGIFQSVESAQTKRQEAIAKGIKDAFITAYYKGERISLEEARKLLLELGNGILEKENVKENKILPADEIRKIEKQTLQARTAEENAARKNGVKEDQVQFVSKKTYDEFPADVLKRFNENGTFFYDPQDKKVKSIVYKNENTVPQLYEFSAELDTVLTAKSDSLYNDQTFEIAAKYPGTELSGEIGDWLLRLGYQREIKRRDDKIQVRIFDIRDERTFDAMLQKMKSLGFTILMAGGEEEH